MKKYIPLLLMSVVMALMPFYPEPHLIKQWNRILDGSFGEFMDYMDLLIHTGPLFFLLYSVITDKSSSNT